MAQTFMIPIPTTNFRSPAALGRFILTTIAGLGLDLWTKAYAFNTLDRIDGLDGQPAVNEFIPGYLHFQVTRNYGAVFGIGQHFVTLFVVISIAAIVFLTYLFATSGRQRFYQFLLGVLLAGVLGNMYDRIHYKFVRDMIHALPRWPNFFPWIFNVADILLCTGVALMIAYSLFSRHQPHQADAVSPARVSS